MNTYKFKRILIKTRGIFLFSAFLFFPILITFSLLRSLVFFAKDMDLPIITSLANDEFVVIFFQTLIFFILFFILYKYKRSYVNYFKKKDLSDLLSKAFLYSIKAFGIGFLITYIIITISSYISGIEVFNDWLNAPNYGFVVLLDNLKKQSHLKVILLFVYIVLFVPIYEEILFRGFLQDSVSRIVKKRNLDIVIVSLVFSLFHLFSLSNMIFAFIVGVFLSRARKKYDTINIPIMIHCIINFTGLLSGIIYQYFSTAN